MTKPLQSIIGVIRSHAVESPKQIALVAAKSAISYAELWHQIILAADWYLSAGVDSGDRIIISTDSRDPYFAAAYLGAHFAGAVAVPTSFRSSQTELSRRRDFVDAKMVLFGEPMLSFRQCMQESGKTVDDPAPAPTIDMSTIAEIMFTTGSTGRPKGVTLTHQNISASATLIRQFIGNNGNDVEVVTVPLTHSFGLGRLRSTLLAGGKLVLVPGLVFPRLTMQALQQHTATGLSCAPGGMRLLLSQCEDGIRELAGQIRYIEMGSTPFSADEKKRLCEILPTTRLCMHYGLTEASRSAFSEFHSDYDHLDSVGRASPGVEVKVLGGNSEILKSGELGRIHVCAPTVMAGYWNDAPSTDRVLDKVTGWLDTGDLGWLDAHDYLHFAGRADDVINCGGVNILPDDLERIAASFPGVADVACRGIPDPDEILGEVPLLCIVPVDESVNVTRLTRYMQSTYHDALPTIVVQIVTQLPRTESGKLLRRKLPVKLD